jgi:hypothetical protein
MSFCCRNRSGAEEMDGMVLGEFSSNAPFSFGDNNRTMIHIHRFAKHAEETFGDEKIKGFNKWLKEVRALEDENAKNHNNSILYVDLEN